MRARDEQIATENIRWWCFILWEIKLKKTLGGVASTLPPLYVRGLTYISLQIQSLNQLLVPNGL